jgi:hypothetical protein
MNELKNLPKSVIEAAQLILDDNISKMDIPDDDEEKDKLSGEHEEVIINPSIVVGRSARYR